MATHVYTFDDPPSERDLRSACQILEKGGVIAYSTDLNWGVGCDVTSSKALDRMHFIKPHHPKDRPFSLLCSTISMASEYANIDQPAYRILRKIWPGPYTVLLERNRNLPKQIKDKRKVVGIRVPANNMLIQLVEMFGMPLATTSVPDLPNGAAPRFGYEVDEVFGHSIDMILDLGTELSGEESTILDMSEGGVVLVREGAGNIDFIDTTNDENNQ